jgi:hypothetical protein
MSGAANIQLWWCYTPLILRSEPQVRVSKDVSLAHPSRRTLCVLLRMREESAR